MIDLRVLQRALIVGIALELAMIGFGHAVPWFRAEWLFGCMLIAGLAGLLYARDVGRGFGAGALGGAALGAACGLAAITAAHFLGDQPDRVIPFGVIVSTLTGAIGGLFGEYDVRLQALIRSLR